MKFLLSTLSFLLLLTSLRAQPTSDTKTSEDFMKEAIAHYDGGRYQQAIRMLDNAIATNTYPQLNDILYYYRATSKFQLEQYAAAVMDLDSAISFLKTPKAHYYYQRAQAHLALQQTTFAQADLEKTLLSDAHHYEARTLLGTFQFQNNQLQEAFANFNKAIEDAPQYAPAYYYRGFVYFHLLEPEKGCADWQKASALGSALAQQAQTQYCRKKTQ